MPAKRYPWQIAEARAWLKRERPKVYAGLRTHAARESQNHDRREDIVTQAVAELMPWLYPAEWDKIETESRKKFESGKPSRNGKIARKIAKKVARELGRTFTRLS